jgi:superfamily II DNA or RNA helicase
MSSPAPRLQDRAYQRECVDAIVSAVERGVQGAATVLPTGAGKSVIIGMLAARPEIRRRGRLLVLAHREELLQQNAAKVRLADPSLRVGILQGARREIFADVVMGSVLSAKSDRNLRALSAIGGVGAVVVDECHHATAASYRRVMNHFEVPRIGFTATMVRGDDASLGEIWTDIVYTRSIAEMIREGYLCGVRGIRVLVKDLDLGKVKRMHGDFSEKALGQALEESLAPGAIARAYVEHAAGKQGIVFAPTVHSAQVIGEALCEAGIKTETVHGEMEADERRAALDRFRAGDVQVLSNCMILTEGTDLPMAEVIVMARPTSNAGLYIQCVGRGLRPHPGKTRALVLDVVGATSKHSLVSPIKLFGDEVKPREVDGDLLELDGYDEEDERGGAGGPEPAVLRDGPLEAVEVDLFHGSASAWLRTKGGTWFLPAGERFIALVPGERGTDFDVVWMWRRKQGSGWVARAVPELGYAMSMAEGNVTFWEKQHAQRAQGWRLAPVSDQARTYAREFGVTLDGLATEGEAYDVIVVGEASKRIDRTQKRRLAALTGVSGS